jgi:hypothetical protein
VVVVDRFPYSFSLVHIVDSLLGYLLTPSHSLTPLAFSLPKMPRRKKDFLQRAEEKRGDRGPPIIDGGQNLRKLEDKTVK